MRAELIISYKATKFNKCDTQYVTEEIIPTNSWLTERVKIEVFQGYSKAYNLGEYFRLRGSTSWKSGEQVSGLWKTDRKDVFYGDRRQGTVKTLLFFMFNNNRDSMQVYVYPFGYYPNKQTIVKLSNDL